MFTPRVVRATILTALLVCLPLIYGLTIRVQANQQSTVNSAASTPGIALYRKGDIKGAITALRAFVKQNKSDADAWHYLGLAFNRDGDGKGAREAFATAIKLRPNFAASHTGLAYAMLLTDKKTKDALREARRAIELNASDLAAHYVIGVVHLREGESRKALDEAEAMLKINPAYDPAMLLKGRALIGIFEVNYPANSEKQRDDYYSLLKETTKSFEERLKLNPNMAEADAWRTELLGLKFYVELNGKDIPEAERTFFSSSEVTTKAQILSKPEAPYTERARHGGVSGTVIIRAILAADGQVRDLRIVKGLSGGLTEQAIKAAHQIKFVPAIKDGRPVSQYIQVEYSFNLY